MKTFLLVSTFSFLATVSHAAETTIQSGPTRTHLLELFTSEGCSSCPPAERWFSSLQAQPQLWKDFVPVAFHVDYWDGLGWKDRLASAANTARQRSYAAAWRSGTVYTPGFVLDGQEWRERDLTNLGATSAKVGVLGASLRENGEVAINFQPTQKSTRGWEAHAALLGLGLSSDVKAGENSGRKLQHDFAALAHQSGAMSAQGDTFRAALKLPVSADSARSSALAVWITEAGRTEPVQAAGGLLSK